MDPTSRWRNIGCWWLLKKLASVASVILSPIMTHVQVDSSTSMCMWMGRVRLVEMEVGEDSRRVNRIRMSIIRVNHIGRNINSQINT